MLNDLVVQVFFGSKLSRIHTHIEEDTVYNGMEKVAIVNRVKHRVETVLTTGFRGANLASWRSWCLDSFLFSFLINVVLQIGTKYLPRVVSVACLAVEQEKPQLLSSWNLTWSLKGRRLVNFFTNLFTPHRQLFPYFFSYVHPPNPLGESPSLRVLYEILKLSWEPLESISTCVFGERTHSALDPKP